MIPKYFLQSCEYCYSAVHQTMMGEQVCCARGLYSLGWRELIEALVDRALSSQIGCPAINVVKDYDIGKNGFHVLGEVQVMVSYSLYYTLRSYEEAS